MCNFNQKKRANWLKNSCDTFTPVGPFIATSDEIEDPNLKPGDEVELGIEGLGISKQKVKAY